MIYYLPGAEPFFYRGDSAGCLLLHGLASSPDEVRWLGQYLAQRGRTVYGARLAGHGADYHDLARVRWRDWYGSALDGYHMLRAQCEQLVLVGHSTGGLLALHMAAALPIDALVILSAPLLFPRRLTALAGLLRWVLPYFYAPDRSDLPEIVRAEQARRGETLRGRARYDLWAMRAVTEFFRLTRVCRDDLPLISAPACLIYARHDEVATLASQELIAAAIYSTVIESHVLEKGGHNVMMDVERERVFQYSADFIDSQLGQP